MTQDIVNENQSLSYTNLDFSSIYTEVLDLTKKLTRDWDPSISDESDPGVILVKLSALLADKCNYNIDKSILEAFPLSVTQDSNARQLYEQLGYYMHWYRASSVPVNIRYKLTSLDIDSFNISKFTTICDDNSKVIYTLVGVDGDDGVVVSDGTLYLNENKTLRMIAYEGIPTFYEFNNSKDVPPSAVSNNRLYLATANVFENGIFINNVGQENFSEWSRVDNLYEYSYNVHRYKFGYDADSNTCYLEFPDNYAELIGKGINITYLTFSNTDSFSDVTADYLCKFVAPPTIVSENSTDVDLTKDVVEIKNPTASTGHLEKEGLDEAYKNYKNVVGTFNTLITLRDYVNYVKSNRLNICSNAVVTDRTNDVQSTYKIVTKAHDVESLITEIEQNPESTRFIKTSDEDVLNTKNYYTKNDQGEYIKVTNPDPSKINTYYESVGDDMLSPFSLKFYLLRKGLAITGTGNSVTMGENYNNTFKLTSNLIDMDSLLEESSHLVHTFEDIQPIPKDLDSAILSRVIMIRNKYPISMNISTYDGVNYDDRLDIYRNIMIAFLNNLDSGNVDFGTNVKVDYLAEIATRSDTRIKSVSFDTLESSTYAVYYSQEDNEYKEIQIPQSINVLNQQLNTDIDSSTLSQEEIFSLKLSSLIGKEIVCKSILKGTTQLLVPDGNFKYHLNQKFLEYRDDVKYITGEAIIDMNNTNASEVYKVVDGDTTLTTNSYKLQENEILTLYKPQLQDNQEFTSGVHYDYNIFSEIKANQSYQLNLGEKFVFYTQNLDSAGKLSSFTVYVYNEGSIISPSFDVPARDRMNLPDVVRSNESLNYESDGEYSDVKVSKTLDNYSYVETSTINVNKINSNAGVSNTKVDTNETIKVQTLNRFTVVPDDGYKFIWVLNKPVYSNDLKSYMLFDGYDSKDDTDLENYNEINHYTLRSGETLFYTNSSMTDIGYLGAGTTIYRECGTDSVNYNEILNDLGTEGQFIFVKWSDLKNNNNYLGSGIIEHTPKAGGLYEYNTTLSKYVRSNDKSFDPAKDYYILLMKDTSGWYLKKNDTNGNTLYYPAASPTTSVFSEVDLINEYKYSGDDPLLKDTIDVVNPQEQGLFEIVTINDEEVIDVYRLGAKRSGTDKNKYTDSELNRKTSTGKYKRYTNTQDTASISSSFIVSDSGNTIDTEDPSTYGNVTIKNEGDYSPYKNNYVTRTDNNRLKTASIEDRLFTEVEIPYQQDTNPNNYFYKDLSTSPTYRYSSDVSGGLELTDSRVSVLTTKYITAFNQSNTFNDLFNSIDSGFKKDCLLDTDAADIKLNKFVQLDSQIKWDPNTPDSILTDKFVELTQDDIQDLTKEQVDYIGNKIHLGFKDSLTEATSNYWDDNTLYKYDVNNLPALIKAEQSKTYKYEPTTDTTLVKDVTYYIKELPLKSYKAVANGKGSYVKNNINNNPTGVNKVPDGAYYEVGLDEVPKITDADKKNYHFLLKYKKITSIDSTEDTYFVRQGKSLIEINYYEAANYLADNTVTVYKGVTEYVLASTNTYQGYFLEYDEQGGVICYVYDEGVDYSPQPLNLADKYDVSKDYAGIYYYSIQDEEYRAMESASDVGGVASNLYYTLKGVTYVGEGKGNLVPVELPIKNPTQGQTPDDLGFVKANPTQPTYEYKVATTLEPNKSYYEKVDNSYVFRFYYDGTHSYVSDGDGLVVDDSHITGKYSIISKGDSEYITSDGKLVDGAEYYYFTPNSNVNSSTLYDPKYMDTDGKVYYAPTVDADYSKLTQLGTFSRLTQEVSTVLDSTGASTEIELSNPMFSNNLPSNSPLRGESFIKNLLINKVQINTPGIFEHDIYINNALCVFDVKSKSITAKPFTFDIYRMFGENTYYNDGKTSTISGQYSSVYTFDSNNKATEYFVARDYYVPTNYKTTESLNLTISGVKCKLGGYTLLPSDSTEVVKPGVDYFVLPTSSSTDTTKPIKINVKPTQFAIGTSVQSSFGSGGNLIFKRFKPRTDHYYFKTTFTGSSGIDSAVSQFASNKSATGDRCTNFRVNRRYYDTTKEGTIVTSNAHDYKDLNPENLCKRLKFTITGKNLYNTSAASGINPSILGYYVRVNISPREWNMLHPDKYEKIYKEHSGIGCFVPLSSALMNHSISRFSNSTNNTFTPFTYEVYTDDSGGLGTSPGDKKYLPLSYTTFNTQFYIVGEPDVKQPFTDVSDRLFTRDETGKLVVTNKSARIGDKVVSLINSTDLYYSYLNNLDELRGWVYILNLYFSTYTTGLYYMPHWFELGKWLKYNNKKYYRPNVYYHKNIEAIAPLICSSTDGIDIASSPAETLTKYFASVQPNTALTFTQNEITTLSEGDIFTMSTNDAYTGNNQLPVFTNKSIVLDLDSYEISYQRKGDSFVGLDKITVEDCNWEAYSNLKINSTGTNGQRLMYNHTLTAYTVDDKEQIIQLGDIIRCTPGNNNIHFQLRDRITANVGSYIDVSTINDLTSNATTLNQLYVYDVSGDSSRYGYSSDYVTSLYFKKVTESEAVKTIFLGIKDPTGMNPTDKPTANVGSIVLPEGKYLLPFNGITGVKINATYCCTIKGTPYTKANPSTIGDKEFTICTKWDIPCYNDLNKYYFLGDKLHFGYLDLTQDIEFNNDWSTLISNGEDGTTNPAGYDKLKDYKVLSGYLIVSIDTVPDWDAVSVNINDIFKFTENTNFGDAFEKIKQTVCKMDKSSRFNYTHEIKEEDLIEDPLTPKSYWNKGHPYNEFTIPQLNIDEISYTFNKTIS